MALTLPVPKPDGWLLLSVSLAHQDEDAGPGLQVAHLHCGSLQGSSSAHIRDRGLHWGARISSGVPTGGCSSAVVSQKEMEPLQRSVQPRWLLRVPWVSRSGSLAVGHPGPSPRCAMPRPPSLIMAQRRFLPLPHFFCLAPLLSPALGTRLACRTLKGAACQGTCERLPGHPARAAPGPFLAWSEADQAEWPREHSLAGPCQTGTGQI